MEGTPIAWVSAQQGSEPPSASNDLDSGITGKIEIGKDRSMDTDIAYGLRQLVDVAARAMSPSLNDPYTAIQALDHLDMLLCKLAREDLDDGMRYDPGGTLVVEAPKLGLCAYVRIACDQPLRYGDHEPAVALRILKLLRDVAALVPAQMDQFLCGEVNRVIDHVERNARPSDDLAPLRAEADTARHWAAGRMTAPDASYMRL